LTLKMEAVLSSKTCVNKTVLFLFFTVRTSNLTRHHVVVLVTNYMEWSSP
jgi:hypothetical protein